jgi:predicted RNA-binding protein with PUA-like domain
MVKQQLEGREHDNILIIDQTPIPFLYHSNKMLNVKGVRTVHARMSTTDTNLILAATVSTSGKM